MKGHLWGPEQDVERHHDRACLEDPEVEIRNCGMLGSCSATRSPGSIPDAVNAAGEQARRLVELAVVSQPPSYTATGRSGAACAFR